MPTTTDSTFFRFRDLQRIIEKAEKVVAPPGCATPYFRHHPWVYVRERYSQAVLRQQKHSHIDTSSVTTRTPLGSHKCSANRNCSEKDLHQRQRPLARQSKQRRRQQCKGQDTQKSNVERRSENASSRPSVSTVCSSTDISPHSSLICLRAESVVVSPTSSTLANVVPRKTRTNLGKKSRRRKTKTQKSSSVGSPHDAAPTQCPLVQQLLERSGVCKYLVQFRQNRVQNE